MSSLPLVLFVDDNAVMLRVVRETAGGSGYQIATSASPKAALDVLRSRQVTVIVADESMPEMSGLELLRVAAQEYPGIGRILLTGRATAELVRRAINEVKVDHLLTKPCRMSDLRAAIAELLETAASRR